MKTSNLTLVLMFSLLVSVRVMSQSPANSNGQATRSITQSNANTDGDKNVLPETVMNQVLEEIRKRENEYDTRWNEYRFAYLACTLLAALLTAVAGLLPKLRPINPDDPIAKQKQTRNENISLILAGISSFLLLINAVGGFSAAAFANRTARGEIRTLKSDVLENKLVNKAAVERKIDEIENKKSLDAVKP